MEASEAKFGRATMWDEYTKLVTLFGKCSNKELVLPWLHGRRRRALVSALRAMSLHDRRLAIVSAACCAGGAR